ncbi:MAG: 2-dehydropantoate 2-reductase [Verrucomicrobiales bacterium]
MNKLETCPRPRIAVIGAGAVGGYYGARLVQGGAEVHFLMRSAVEHVRRRGFHVRSHTGDFVVSKVNAHRTPGEIGLCDLVIIALKATANEALIELIPPLLGDETMLLTLQNGLGSDEFLAAQFGAARVLGGLCFVCLNRTSPGEIHHIAEGQISLGEFSGAPRRRTRRLAALFAGSGVPCRVVKSLAKERWKKLAWNVPFNGLSIAAGGIDTSRILADSRLNYLARQLIREIIEAGTRLGHRLPRRIEWQHMAATETMGAYRPSSLVDFLAGRDVEVEAIWGEPLRRAESAGAKVPRLKMLYALVRSQVAARDDHAVPAQETRRTQSRRRKATVLASLT